MEILEKYKTSYIPVKEYVFEQAERPFFGSISIISISSGLSSALGKFTYFFNLSTKFELCMTLTQIHKIDHKLFKKETTLARKRIDI